VFQCCHDSRQISRETGWLTPLHPRDSLPALLPIKATVMPAKKDKRVSMMHCLLICLLVYGPVAGVVLEAQHTSHGRDRRRAGFAPAGTRHRLSPYRGAPAGLLKTRAPIASLSPPGVHRIPSPSRRCRASDIGNWSEASLDHFHSPGVSHSQYLGNRGYRLRTSVRR